MKYNSYACDVSYLCLTNIGVIYYILNKLLRLKFLSCEVCWLFIFGV